MSENRPTIEKLTAEFKKKLHVNGRTKYATPQQKGFRIGCLNVRSLLEDREENIAKVINHYEFDVFILQETSLYRKRKPRTRNREESPAGYRNLNVPKGFDWARDERWFATKSKSGRQIVKLNEERGGGQLIYVRKGVDWEVRSQGEFGNRNIQYLHIEITKPIQLHLIAVYCPPRDENYKLLYTLMSWYIAALPQGVPIMFIGDVNIDWFKREPIQYEFCETLEKWGIHQLIQSVTYPAWKSCLDHIYTDVPAHKILESGVMVGTLFKQEEVDVKTDDLSADHLPIFCTIQVNENPSGQTGHATEKKIAGGNLYMYCKLTHERDRNHQQSIPQNSQRIADGFLVLYEVNQQAIDEDFINWVTGIHDTYTIAWCDVFFTTENMLALLKKQLPTSDFYSSPW